MEIENIKARQILDSRGNPTVEADVYLSNGIFGRAAVPSGASTGKHEAHELRDGGTIYGGLGVEKAIKNIEEIILPGIKGYSADNQDKIDRVMCTMDGTANKHRLGANSILAVSLACADAVAAAKGVPLYQYIQELSGTQQASLPMPMMNILNGGRHAAGSTDIQEMMIIPIGAKNMSHAIRIGSEVFHSLQKLLTEKHYATTVGDEGGFAPHLRGHNTQSLKLVAEAVTAAGYQLGQDVALALDVASSELFDGNNYIFKSESKSMHSKGLIAWYKDLCQEYPIFSIEDGLSEDEWAGWQNMTEILRDIQLVGDDLLVTNLARLQKAIANKAGNAILIKPNQIGTLSETIQAIKLAQQNNWGVIVSHRSGETEDTFIAHLAVGTGAGQIKTGSLDRGERTAKYNELLRIEEDNPSLKLAHPF